MPNDRVGGILCSVDICPLLFDKRERKREREKVMVTEREREIDRADNTINKAQEIQYIPCF